ncbi:MAG TPA: nucleotide exchange factor GrpE [Mycobacteriales bacterium]|jgi:molecular chaperone GrpE|nr:nucleotide exchange factor GrpE [Mycobacteriales bacterium]
MQPDSAAASPPQEDVTSTDAAVVEPGEGKAIGELEDRLRRALADLENLRKRHARDLGRELAAERASVAAAWLPVLDGLDQALSYAEADPAAIVAGVRAVRDQALRVLAGLGFPRDEEAGVPFDPSRHEVAQVVETSDVAPGTVVRVLRPGYGEADRQLRPGAVAVAANGG